METKTSEARTSDLDENPLDWIICKTGARRIFAESFLSCVRYCANQVPKRMTLDRLRILAALLVILMPRPLTYVLLYPIFRLVFGNLYPAYASYKAVRTKNVKEYVKWMMYWIVFALFTCAETFTDVFFSFWFPFYYEIKTILVVWLLSPATKGSSILYRRFVHPALIRREAEIDDALARATEQGYTAVLHLGTKGVNYATTVLMQTAIKGGGGLVQHLKKSYSLSDLTGEKEDENRNTPHMHDETDMEVEPRRREHVGRRSYSPRRTQSSSNRMELYFSEVDVDVRQPRSREPTASLTNIRSSDDISSGYSSGEALQSTRTSQGDSLVRTSSVGARTRAKPRSTTKKTPEDSGEDTGGIDPPSFKNISFPTPLTHVTPEQALEILLLLSQNSNVADYIKLGRPFLAGNDDSLENTSQSGPQPCGMESKSSEPVPIAEVQVIQSIETKTVAEQPSTNDTSNKELSHSISDELCQNKFDELKQLLSDAHKAVSSIVYTQESKHDGTSITETDSSNVDVKKEDTKIVVPLKTSEDTQLSTETEDSINKVDSEYEDANRAGKYHKKPAPKAPLAKSEEDMDETDSQNALKATLVIKTGTVKTFSNISSTKDVFIAHATDGKPKGKKSKRQRTKEGFSKLLTIPKNIFHNAFSKEQKGVKAEDSVSETSESRSNSIESQETIIELAPKSHRENADDKSENDTSNSSGSYILASNDEANEIKKENKDIDETKPVATNSESTIREMSQSPKAGKRLESDIY
ncbi:uncharacterized protein LOC100882255 [Megachile rotundata]|uniref:uncharacterized protein LOC100882255 n=1 Tax=Megachile rotundata TaxID=143995 RepID=UPI000258E93E